MTQVPLPKKPITPTNIDSIDNWNSHEDWQARMADLVGFEEIVENQPESTLIASNEESSLASQPQPVKTKKTLAENPFAKASLVGATTLITVLVGGVFLTKMMNGTSNQPNYVPDTPKVNKEPEIAAPRPEDEIEVLKTKLALAEQANAVKLAQLQLRTVQPNPQQTVTSTPTTTVQTQAKPREIIRTVVQRVPKEAPTVYIPRTVTVERIVPRTVTVERIVPRTVTVERIVRVGQPVVKPTPVTVVSSNPQVMPAKVEPPLASTLLPAIPPKTIAIQPIQPPVNTPPAPTNQTTESNVGMSKPVPVGTSAKAVLTTALFGEMNKAGNDNNNNDNDNTFVVTLKEPLKTADNEIALPAGTELLTQIRRISDAGVIELMAVSVVSLKDGKASEIPLPNSAIKIRASKGKPLIANKYHDKGGAIAGMDAGLFALGGIGKAAEILNRPQTQYITTASGNIVTDSNPRGNVATGVLEGGMGTIVPQITVRNQQAISEMMGRGNLWYLRAGTDVEVYVNKIVSTLR